MPETVESAIPRVSAISGAVNRKRLSAQTSHFSIYQPLIPGEVLKCDLMLPASRSLKKSKMALHCTVEVLRIEERTLGFGWACRIQNYSVAE